MILSSLKLAVPTLARLQQFFVRAAPLLKRAAFEIVCLIVALLAAEAVLLGRSPETWSDDPRVQRRISQARQADLQGLSYDGRLRMDVVRDLAREGREALPGFAQGMGTHPAVAAAIRKRGLLPLTNVRNAYVVECNEGSGYLRFRSDEYGFNNPPGLTSRQVSIAIVGESHALGHCVAPHESAAALVRARYPHTATYGIPGSRVLSQLGIFREYVEPFQPPVVVWFVNTNYAEPRAEAEIPTLVNYLDPSFSQDLMNRQSEVDAFVREVVLPLEVQQDEALRQELARSERFPLDAMFKVREIRRLVGAQIDRGNTAPPRDFGTFRRAIKSAESAISSWGGRLIVVVLPAYAISMAEASSVARYRSVLKVLQDEAGIRVVDAVEVFAEEPDMLSLYALRTDGHPSARGHAVIARAVIAAIERENVL